MKGAMLFVVADKAVRSAPGGLSHGRDVAEAMGRGGGATQAGRVRRRGDAGRSGRSAAGRDTVRQVEQSAGATQTSRATQRPARRCRHLAWRGREQHGEVDAQLGEVGSTSSKQYITNMLQFHPRFQQTSLQGICYLIQRSQNS